MGAAVLFVAAALLGFLLDRRVPSFDSLPQARELLQVAGYCCTGDRPDGKMGFSFIVSREPLAWEEVGNMYKAGPMGPKWKGRVWIVATSPNILFHSLSGEMPPRIWGKVLAIGDHDLLDEIERCSFQ